MFAIRFTNGMTHETVYNCYSYSVTRPAICNADHPVITMAMSQEVNPHHHDHRAINVVVAEAAFVMNENGKTIDRIFTGKTPETIFDPSVFKSESQSDVEEIIYNDGREVTQP
jgi:hypothetical protein